MADLASLKCLVQRFYTAVVVFEPAPESEALPLSHRGRKLYSLFEPPLVEKTRPKTSVLARRRTHLVTTRRLIYNYPAIK